MNQNTGVRQDSGFVYSEDIVYPEEGRSAGMAERKRKHISGQDFILQKKETQNELREKRRKVFREIRALLLVVFSAAVLGYAFITFVMQTVTVRGPSMEPTLQSKDTVLLNKLAYLFSDVERGDIVAISAIGSDEYYDIKRVIAIPGDKVAVLGGRFLVNDSPLDPAYDPGTVSTVGRLTSSITLGENEYFVIGDNLGSSEDSRFSTYGNVMKNSIRGKIFYRLTKGKRGKIGVEKFAEKETGTNDAGNGN